MPNLVHHHLALLHHQPPVLVLHLRQKLASLLLRPLSLPLPPLLSKPSGSGIVVLISSLPLFLAFPSGMSFSLYFVVFVLPPPLFRWFLSPLFLLVLIFRFSLHLIDPATNLRKLKKKSINLVLNEEETAIASQVHSSLDLPQRRW